MAGERILFADDDAQIRKLVSAFLTRRGYQVRLVADGADALRMIADDPPHLLITDVNMPFMTGLELTRRLRADHRFARLPILMLSARKQAEDILSGYNEGADDYIPKPVEMAVLAAKVETMLKRMGAAAAATVARGASGKVVAFLHAKGGVGTTTLAANVAVALASASMYRVALLDLSMPYGNAGLLLDIRAQRTLGQLAELPAGEVDDETFDTFVQRHQSGVRVVAAPDVPERAELVTVPVVQDVIERLRRGSDYLVIDTPSTLTEPVLAALDAADVAVVVTVPHIAALRATADLLATLPKLGVRGERIMLTLVRTAAQGLDNEQVSTFLERKPDALIPHSTLFDEAADAGRPLFTEHPDNAAAAAVRQLAAKIAKAAPVAAPAG